MTREEQRAVAMERAVAAARDLLWSTWKETTPEHVALRQAFAEALGELDDVTKPSREQDA